MAFDGNRSACSEQPAEYLADQVLVVATGRHQRPGVEPAGGLPAAGGGRRPHQPQVARRRPRRPRLAKAKTSMDASSDPLFNLSPLSSSGQWSSDVDPGHDSTRAIVQIDTPAARSTASARHRACSGGTIYMKKAALDNLQFSSGLHSFIHKDAHPEANNPYLDQAGRERHHRPGRWPATTRPATISTTIDLGPSGPTRRRRRRSPARPRRRPGADPGRDLRASPSSSEAGYDASPEPRRRNGPSLHLAQVLQVAQLGSHPPSRWRPPTLVVKHRPDDRVNALLVRSSRYPLHRQMMITSAPSVHDVLPVPPSRSASSGGRLSFTCSLDGAPAQACMSSPPTVACPAKTFSVATDRGLAKGIDHDDPCHAHVDLPVPRRSVQLDDISCGGLRQAAGRSRPPTVARQRSFRCGAAGRPRARLTSTSAEGSTASIRSPARPRRDQPHAGGGTPAGSWPAAASPSTWPRSMGRRWMLSLGPCGSSAILSVAGHRHTAAAGASVPTVPGRAQWLSRPTGPREVRLPWSTARGLRGR